MAQDIADRLRAGTPVLVDLRGCDPQLTGRLTDFCSGLVYALEGTLQHVGREVLLLAPDHVDVSGDEASAVREPGFYNPGADDGPERPSVCPGRLRGRTVAGSSPAPGQGL